MAVAIVGGAVALAFWPIQGRTGEQWLPLVLRWTWARTIGSGRWLAPGPRAGHVTTVGQDGTRSTPLRPGGDRRPGPARARARVSPFDRLEVVGVPFEPEHSSAEMGMVVAARARTATGVLAVRGHSFALL